MPLKLNMMQVLVNYKRFARSTIWHKFWFGNDTGVYVPPIFKTKKDNLPVKYPFDKGIYIFNVHFCKAHFSVSKAVPRHIYKM